MKLKNKIGKKKDIILIQDKISYSHKIRITIERN